MKIVHIIDKVRILHLLSKLFYWSELAMRNLVDRERKWVGVDTAVSFRISSELARGH